MPLTEVSSSVSERTDRERTATRIAASSLEALTGRDLYILTETPKTGREPTRIGSGGSLRVYDLDLTGAHTEDTVSGSTEDNFTLASSTDELGEFSDIIRSETILPRDAQERLGMVLPDIVGALALDRRYTNKIYRPDIPSLAKIAIGLATNPEIVDQTHIRVGFGGDKRVSALGPAYIAPGLKMIQRLKDTFDLQRDYALLNELMDAHPEGIDKDEWKATIRREFDDAIGKPASGKKTGFEGKVDERLSVHVREGVTQDDIKNFLLLKWEEKTGKLPDLDALGKKYFFPPEGVLPKLVVFNASQAATALNKMNPAEVFAAREGTKKLLKAYTEAVHPDIASTLHFQDDTNWRSWAFYKKEEVPDLEDAEVADWRAENAPKDRLAEQEAAYAKLFVYYASDVLGKLNGNVRVASERLAKFGEHHREDKTTEGEENKPFGMEPDEVYGRIHGEFFMDGSEADFNDRLPKTIIMEDTPIPVNTLYLQGHPEITFGVLRKLLRKHASLSSFTAWLEERRDGAQLASIAQDVATRADISVAENTERPYQEALGQAINDWVTEQYKAEGIPLQTKGAKKDKVKLLPEQEATKKAIEQTRGRLIANFKTTAYKETDDKKEAWHQVVDRYTSVDPEETEAAYTYIIDRKQARSNVLYSDSTNSEVRQSEAAISIYQRQNQVEQITEQGRTAVYYFVEGLDAVLWPNGEIPTLQKYEDHFKEVTRRDKAQQGTGIIGVDYAKGVTTKMKLHLKMFDTQEVAVDDIVEARNTKLVSDFTEKLRHLYTVNYNLEKSGTKGNELKEELWMGVNRLARLMILDIAEKQQISLGEASRYVINHNLLQKVADNTRKVVGEENSVAVSVAEGRVIDYRTILDDINPADHKAAEATFHRVLTETSLDPYDATPELRNLGNYRNYKDKKAA